MIENKLTSDLELIDALREILPAARGSSSFLDGTVRCNRTEGP